MTQIILMTALFIAVFGGLEVLFAFALVRLNIEL